MAAQAVPAETPQLVLLDTDIGDDIDDAFALALVLQSPELKLLGITTAYGDTELRAKLVARYLHATGRDEIPVSSGVQTPHDNVFTQAAYAKQSSAVLAGACALRLVSVSQIPIPKREQDRYDACEKESHDASGFILRNAREHPGEITLIAIGPLNNIEAAIKQDPETFRKLKRVVMMGGSIYRGYDGPTANAIHPTRSGTSAATPRGCGAAGFRRAGPHDAPRFHANPPGAKGAGGIFAHGSSLTDQLTLLYHQWNAGNDGRAASPTLYDPVAVAYAIRPDLCPATPLRLEVTTRGIRGRWRALRMRRFASIGRKRIFGVAAGSDFEGWGRVEVGLVCRVPGGDFQARISPRMPETGGRGWF